MNILYRRFVLVAAFVSALGAITANIIKDTRTVRFQPINSIERIHPVSADFCRKTRLCSATPNAALATSVLRG